MKYSLPRAYAVFCGRFIITVNWDYLYAQKQGKLASICLQRFSSIFETIIIGIPYMCKDQNNWLSFKIFLFVLILIWWHNVKIERGSK